MMDEQILVIPEQALMELIDNKRGLISVNKEKAFKVIQERGCFKPRTEMETNPGYKQVIPYILMKDSKGKVLVLKRLTTQSEKRLHNKLSLGIGGHVNSTDSEIPVEALKEGMKREIQEEVNVTLLETPRFQGIIYDDTTPVGKVHMGHAYSVTVDFFGLNEPDKFACSWEEPSQLKPLVKDMENWSGFLVDKLYRD